MKNLDIKEIENITEQFKFTSISKIKKFLIGVFKTKYNVVENKFGFTYKINNEKNYVFLYYDTFVLNMENAINIYRQLQSSKVNKILILCFSYSSDCESIVRRFKAKKLELLDIQALYFDVLKQAKMMPTFEVEKIKSSIDLKFVVRSALSKKKAKSYFGFGLLIFISSFFVPLSLYYLILSLILFTLSFVSRFIYQDKINSSSTPIY